MANAITTQKDWLGTTTLARQGIINGTINLYIISMQGMRNTYSSSSLTDTIITIPPTEQILSCYFFPYIDYNDCATLDVDYDEKAFPLPYNTGDTAVENLTVTRLQGLGDSGLKVVGTFNKYEIEGTDVGGNFKWQNEGKLWLYPFTQVIAYDNITEPFMINPLLINDDNTDFEIICRNSLNHLGLYTLYVDNYRGSSQGQLYGQTVGRNAMPLVSSTYTNYMAENSFNQKADNIKNLQNLLSNILTNPLGAITDALNNYGDQKLAETNALQSGYILSSSGSDTTHDLQMFGGMTVAYQQSLEPYMNQMGWFFHQYGYAQNKIMMPNITSRKYWNYIKTSDIKIKVPNCPKEHLNTLEGIFNNGVTVWHLEQSDMYENLDKDNVEL